MPGRRRAAERLPAWQLVRRSWRHRSGQLWLAVVVSALISATLVFVSGYQHQAQQTIVDATLAAATPGNTWELSGTPGSDLPALLPPASVRLAEAPVAGAVAELTWTSDQPGTPSSVSGDLIWREHSCEHLVMVEGRCPTAAGQVAVSAVDAKAYRLQPGQSVEQRNSVARAHTYTICGIYRPDAPDDPYWFGHPPTGRSGFDAAENAFSDQLITVPSRLTEAGYSETLDVRIDHTAVRVEDLATLAEQTRELADAALHHQSRLVTGLPASLTRIAEERARFATGLALIVAQLGVLALVVVALLSAVVVSDQRRELGLARLRGEAAPVLRRILVARWAVVITIGWSLGWLPGLALVAALAHHLPGQHAPPLGGSSLVAPLACWVLMVLVIVPGARAMLAQPVLDLLRGTSSTAATTGRQLVTDIALVVLALCGVAVGVQTGTSSVLGLLVPSLLAVGAGVLLHRALTRLAVRSGPITRGRLDARALLTRALIVRLRGGKLLMVATCLAAAFAVFAVQVQTIGAAVRGNVAAVTTGSAVVLQVDGQPAAVAAALDRLDTRNGTPDAAMTEVVLTRRRDAAALRGMFVDPARFAAVAYGAERVTDGNGWRSISAPQVDPVVFTGSGVTAEIAAHAALGRSSDTSGGQAPQRTGTRAALGIDYLSEDGVLHSLVLGQVRLSPGPGQHFRRPVPCRAGCRLLRITVAPNGPMDGRLRLTSLGAERAPGTAQPVALGAADQWQTVAASDPEARLRVSAGAGLALTGTSGGAQIAVQHAWLPTALPVLTAADVQTGEAPSLAAPDGTPLLIRPVARAHDAIPGQLDGVAVADLASLLRTGHQTAGAASTVQVWLAPAAAERLPEVERQLADQGIRVIRTGTVQQALAVQRSTASALSGQIAPGLALLAGALAALGIVLTVAGQRSVLARDLAALRLAGVRDQTLRRAVSLALLVPALLAVVAGTVAATVGAALVTDDLPLLPNAEPAIRAELGVRVDVLEACSGSAVIVVSVAVLLSVRWLWRGADIDQLRSTR